MLLTVFIWFFGQAFASWVHICVIRLFVESILRYGLPPSFVPGIILPEEKKVKKLKQLLETTFGDTGECGDGYRERSSCQLSTFGALVVDSLCAVTYLCIDCSESFTTGILG